MPLVLCLSASKRVKEYQCADCRWLQRLTHTDTRTQEQGRADQRQGRETSGVYWKNQTEQLRRGPSKDQREGEYNLVSLKQRQPERPDGAKVGLNTLNLNPKPHITPNQ